MTSRERVRRSREKRHREGMRLQQFWLRHPAIPGFIAEAARRVAAATPDDELDCSTNWPMSSADPEPATLERGGIVRIADRQGVYLVSHGRPWWCRARCSPRQQP